MSSSSTDSTYSVPNFSEVHFNAVQDAEAAASRALKNIQSLYNEIMTPKAYPEFEDELCEENDIDSSVSLPTGRSRCKVFHNSKPPPQAVRKPNSSKMPSKNNRAFSISSDDSSVSEPSNPCDNYLIPNEKIKITVPKPFSLCKENIKRQEAKKLKIAKLQEELIKQSEKELKVRITSRPVPKHVNLPLYEEMVARNEKRKMDRREKSQEIIKNLKPFELSYMKSSLTRSQSVGNLPKDSSCSNFKAKPVPKCILDENLTKKLKNKEEIRKLLNAQRAEEMLKKSSLPFTPKNVRNAYSTCCTNIKSKDKPKFSQQEVDAVTKRLYTIKCKEALEDWNNKVLQNNLWLEKDSAHNKSSRNTDQKNSPVHVNNTLPFYSFPVRMSTASILRDKLIREEIMKRDEKKDDKNFMKTEKKRKDFVKNIWPRLKSAEQNINFEENIIEKVKSHRESQKSRELEYFKELEEMMERVLNQNLLIERQSKGSTTNLKANSEEKLSSSKEVSDGEPESSDEHTENGKSTDESSENAESSHPSED